MSLQGLWLLLWHESDPWPKNLHILRSWHPPSKKKKKKRKWAWSRIRNFVKNKSKASRNKGREVEAMWGTQAVLSIRTIEPEGKEWAMKLLITEESKFFGIPSPRPHRLAPLPYSHLPAFPTPIQSKYSHLPQEIQTRAGCDFYKHY